MIENFDEVKRQLKELSDVINAFKSESVQLRIIELVFGEVSTAHDDEGQIHQEIKRRTRRKRPVKKGSNEESAVDGQTSKSGKKRSGGSGAVSTLVTVFEKGFFAKPRAIKDILDHCETNLARKIKANEISGKLGRMVRNGELTRSKNADGQYEYKNA
jgi:hypothetical protein